MVTRICGQENGNMVGWLCLTFRNSTPIYCPLRRTWSSVNTPTPPGIEPKVVVWQSITLQLHGNFFKLEVNPELLYYLILTVKHNRFAYVKQYG